MLWSITITNSSTVRPEFDAEEMSKVCDRLARVAWLKGQNIVTAQGVSLRLTALVRRRMLSIGKMILPVVSEFFALSDSARSAGEEFQVRFITP